MKRTFILFAIFLVMSVIHLYAQSNSTSNPNEDPVPITIKTYQNIDNAAYELFPTQNMWTFIKLNTKNGRIWQVQFDVNGNDRFETVVNAVPLVSEENTENGRFMLYPTQNMYTFILLDQIDGRMWQMQWSNYPENRGILPIN